MSPVTLGLIHTVFSFPFYVFGRGDLKKEEGNKEGIFVTTHELKIFVPETPSCIDPWLG